MKTKKPKARAQNSAANSAKPIRGNPAKIRPYQFKPGQSGNPGGRPKDDAAEIARAIFEHNEEAIYKAMLTALKQGNPKVFSALADRGYGKVPQHVSVGNKDGEALNFSVNVKFVSSRNKS